MTASVTKMLDWKVALIFPPNIAQKSNGCFTLNVLLIYLAPQNCKLFGPLFQENLPSRLFEKIAQTGQTGEY